ncbi:MAG: hypothetical protein F4Z28_00185 [Gammaproteobacteria bacterium]|nr:hypothetical protein [Gammaproteobacteria bacterium]
MLELTGPAVPWTDNPHNRFDDLNGLGRLRVVLSGASTGTLAASDFPVLSFPVPSFGTIRVSGGHSPPALVRLRDRD